MTPLAGAQAHELVGPRDLSPSKIVSHNNPHHLPNKPLSLPTLFGTFDTILPHC
jgi:hypothetical protein